MNLEQSFNKLINSTYTKYRGCLIEKVGSAYRVLGETFTTIEFAKRRIDESLDTLINKLKQDNNEKASKG